MKRFLSIFLVIIFWTLPLEAGIGVNFGSISAVGELGNLLNTGICGNIFLETSRILFPFQINVGITEQTKKEDNKTKLLMIPITLSYIKYYSWSARYYPFLKFGLGGVFEKVSSSDDNFTNLDPTAVATLGLKLKIHKNFSLRPELSYMFVFQRDIEEAKYNGHFISFYIGVIYK